LQKKQETSVAALVRQFVRLKLAEEGTAKVTGNHQSSPTSSSDRPPESVQQTLDAQSRHISCLEQQLAASNKALDQSQQLHAVSQKTMESQRLQLEESQRPKPLMARLKAVFVAE
jgi:hypothetical protein